jgi:hypothetical protein
MPHISDIDLLFFGYEATLDSLGYALSRANRTRGCYIKIEIFGSRHEG